ncbi:MAG: hypothetical protein U0487_02805 [Patescibacteria group bacterium]
MHQHVCDRCLNPIDPGEEYEGSILLYERGKLLVLKMHISPCCDYPDEPSDDSGGASNIVRVDFKKRKRAVLTRVA